VLAQRRKDPEVFRKVRAIVHAGEGTSARVPPRRRGEGMAALGAPAVIPILERLVLSRDASQGERAALDYAAASLVPISTRPRTQDATRRGGLAGSPSHCAKIERCFGAWYQARVCAAAARSAGSRRDLIRATRCGTARGSRSKASAWRRRATRDPDPRTVGVDPVPQILP
jgi:hypothetical protein